MLLVSTTTMLLVVFGCSVAGVGTKVGRVGRKKLVDKYSFSVGSVGNGVNSNRLVVVVVIVVVMVVVVVEVVVVTFVVVVVVVVVGPLVGTVGTSGVVVGVSEGMGVVGKGESGLKPGGSSLDTSSRMTETTFLGVVGGSGVVVGGGMGESGLKPGGSSLDTSSRMTGTAGETRNPSIKKSGGEGGVAGGEVGSSSSGRLAALDTVLTLIADSLSLASSSFLSSQKKLGLSVCCCSSCVGAGSVVPGLNLLLAGILVPVTAATVGTVAFLLPVIPLG